MAQPMISAMQWNQRVYRPITIAGEGLQDPDPAERLQVDRECLVQLRAKPSMAALRLITSRRGHDTKRDDQRQVPDKGIARGAADSHHGQHRLDAHQLQRDVEHGGQVQARIIRRDRLDASKCGRHHGGSTVRSPTPVGESV
jgi:hypothetical protein